MRDGNLPVRLVISVDVEEEGLFGGVYARNEESATAENVASLRRLDFCAKDYGAPLTLLLAWPVLRDDTACAEIKRQMRENNASVGAHLHHWNTPPLEELPYPDPVPSRLVPENLMRAKLQTLCNGIEERFGARPLSFRMGRFDWCDSLASMLLEAGIRVDSSLVPLRTELGHDRPDHFRVRARPFDLAPGLLEAPLTIQPLSEAAARLTGRVAGSLSESWRRRLQRVFGTVAVAGIAPLWYPLASMKLATRLHLARGGRVLNMFLHSSELMPGGSPQVPDEAAARRLTEKIRAYLEWLHERCDVQGVPLETLAQDQGGTDEDNLKE